jgi:hypothetical protein
MERILGPCEVENADGTTAKVIGVKDLDQMFSYAQSVVEAILERGVPNSTAVIAMALGIMMAMHHHLDREQTLEKLLEQMGAVALAGAAGAAITSGFTRPEALEIAHKAKAAFDALEAKGWQYFKVFPGKDEEGESK